MSRFKPFVQSVKLLHRSLSRPSIQRSSKNNLPAHPLLHLQQSAGNQAVSQLVQAKLKVNRPDDKYEREADRVAEQIMQRPLTSSGNTAVSPQATNIQRMTPEEDEEETPQAKEMAGQAPKLTTQVETNLNNMKGSGQKLTPSVRAFFEPRFGQSFDRVHIHTDGQAAETARQVNARAFTVGNNVAFGSGQYAPQTNSGKRLLAHELTHVVQQTGGNRTSQDSTATTVQRQTIQRNELPAPLSPSHPQNRAAIYSAVRESMEQEEAPVRRWLDENINNLRLLSMAAIVQRVQRNVPGAAAMPAIQIENVIQEWAKHHKIEIPRLSVIPQPGESVQPPSSDANFAALGKLFSIPTKVETKLGSSGSAAISISGASVDLHGVSARPRGTVGFSGAEVEIRPGSSKIKGTVGWDGTLGFTTSHGGFSFSGSLSSDEWKLTTSYSLGPATPDLSQLALIFMEGELALRQILAATGQLDSLENVTAVKEAISPHVKPVKKAVETAAKLAKSSEKRIGLGISAGASGPRVGGEFSGPPGFEVKATLTIRF